MLRLLREMKLYAKYSKYELWLSSMSFLKYMVSKEGVMVDPQKIVKTKNWSRPTFVTKNHNFIGFASYYHKFANGFLLFLHV